MNPQNARAPPMGSMFAQSTHGVLTVSNGPRYPSGARAGVDGFDLPSAGRGAPFPHLRRDWAHSSHICTGTGLTPSHICAGTRLAASTFAFSGAPVPHSAPGPGAPLPHICAGTLGRCAISDASSTRVRTCPRARVSSRHLLVPPHLPAGRATSPHDLAVSAQDAATSAPGRSWLAHVCPRV